jgi:hypothetical protein
MNESLTTGSREADHQDAVGGRDAHAHDRSGERGNGKGGIAREQHPDNATADYVRNMRERLPRMFPSAAAAVVAISFDRAEKPRLLERDVITTEPVTVSFGTDDYDACAWCR